MPELAAKVYYFHWVDYLMFGLMLLLSASTGVWYGCKSKFLKSEEKQSLREYLSGSGKMTPFPVAMSLVASYVSGVTMLGTPTEIYNFGCQYWLIAIAIWFSGATVAFVYLPVFFTLQVASSYEYLELRFGRLVRTLAAIFFLMDEIMFLPILVYVPSLAFNQVTGINTYLIGGIVSSVCVFYTVLGGLKAVVWSDTFQISVMTVSVIVVVILGTFYIGGFEKIIEKSQAGNRLQFFNFSSSMYERYSVFGVIIGGFTYWTSFNSVNQTMVQRYLALPTLKKSKAAVAMFTGGVSLFVFLCCFSGILVYATYFGCDPLLSGRIKADDQLLPLFVMETAGAQCGIPGLFIAGVFGAALSSLSVVLNSSSAVFLEDLIKGCLRLHLSEKIGNILVKTVCVVLGIFAIAFVFIVEHLGGILALAGSLSAIAAGTTFGVFSLGMLVPWANSAGAMVGALCGIVVSALVSFGNHYASAAGLVVPHKLDLSVDRCPEMYGINVNVTEVVYPDESGVFPLFRLSYMWITPIGVSTVITIGTLVSIITGKLDLKQTDPELLSPVVHWMLPPEAQENKGSAMANYRRKRQIPNISSLVNQIDDRNNSIQMQVQA